MPILAIRRLASFLGEGIAALGAIALGAVAFITFIMYVIWLLLTGDWTQLGALLRELLDWLRSAGLV